MVDRVYKSDIPQLRKALERLRGEFSKLHAPTDWTRLRVDPVLRHARELERRLKSQGSTRLTKGVRLFHSDLVYLRENVSGLKAVLESEMRTRGRKGSKSGRRR
jgi:hypothetical protein